MQRVKMIAHDLSKFNVKTVISGDQSEDAESRANQPSSRRDGP